MYFKIFSHKAEEKGNILHFCKLQIQQLQFQSVIVTTHGIFEAFLVD